MSQPVVVNVDKPIASIKLNRSDARNALTDEMLSIIEDGLKKSEHTDGVRCVLMEAAGRSFCVGADISVVEGYTDDELREFLRHASDTCLAIENASFPVISAVSGRALGGGMELMMATDITIAHEESSFGVPEAKLGLLPAAGGTQRLPRIVGKKVASELLFTGKAIGSNRARSLGLINTITQDDPANRARTVANEVAQVGPIAVASCKRLLNDGPDLPLEEALDLEQSEAYRLIDSSDSSEGIDAFIENREPQFKNQ